MFTQMPNFAEGGFEFLRKLWGGGFAGMTGGGMPGMANFAAPPMDLEELDKRIHDLRAVESWLQLNASLLRTAIQGLEVQRATLVALQTFGSALSPEAVRAAFDNFSGSEAPAAEAAAEPEPKSAWPHTSTAARPDRTEAEAPAADEAAAAGPRPPRRSKRRRRLPRGRLRRRSIRRRGGTCCSSSSTRSPVPRQRPCRCRRT